MAIIITRPAMSKPHHRRAQYNAAVRKLASAIAEIRAKEVHGNLAIANALNDMGLVAPSGGPFTKTTTGDILKRLKKLGLGDGPRSRSEAARARPADYQSRPRSTGRRRIPAEELALLVRYENGDEPR